MTETVSITYTKCGFCTAKNHCAACGAEIAQALSEKPGIVHASVDMKAKTLHISYTADCDALEDILDSMGVITD